MRSPAPNHKTGDFAIWGIDRPDRLGDNNDMGNAISYFMDIGRLADGGKLFREAWNGEKHIELQPGPEGEPCVALVESATGKIFDWTQEEIEADTAEEDWKFELSDKEKPDAAPEAI